MAGLVLVAAIVLAYPVWWMHWEVERYLADMNNNPFAREMIVRLSDNGNGDHKQALAQLRDSANVALVEPISYHRHHFDVHFDADQGTLASMNQWTYFEFLPQGPDLVDGRRDPLVLLVHAGHPDDTLAQPDAPVAPLNFNECGISEGLWNYIGQPVRLDLVVRVERGRRVDYSRLSLKGIVKGLKAPVVFVSRDWTLAAEGYVRGNLDSVDAAKDHHPAGQRDEQDQYLDSGLRVAAREFDLIPAAKADIKSSFGLWSPWPMQRVELDVDEANRFRDHLDDWRQTLEGLVLGVWLLTACAFSRSLVEHAREDLVTLGHLGYPTGYAWAFPALPLCLLAFLSAMMAMVAVVILGDGHLLSDFLASVSGKLWSPPGPEQLEQMLADEHREVAKALVGLFVVTWLVSWFRGWLEALLILRARRS